MWRTLTAPSPGGESGALMYSSWTCFWGPDALASATILSPSVVRITSLAIAAR